MQRDDKPPKKMSVHVNPLPIDICFQNVSYSIPVTRFGRGRKVVLKGVSGTFKSGELTAIMGPSGAGKSTLLNILSGFCKEGMDGIITTTNQLKTKKFRKNELCRKDSCYIMQDDQLCHLHSVNEVMRMASNLKLGSCIDSQSKSDLIDEVLDTIGLLKVKDTNCGRLSGGQKKRLSIALELIDNPPIMFLDEPTTGLDSSSCHQTVSMLRKLARGGRTIVCTIHQPNASVFEMFDHVYIIAEGMCVYQGSCFNVIPYLQTIGLNCPQYHNPADFMLEVVSGEYGHFTSQLVAIANDSCWRVSPPSNKSSLSVPDTITEIPNSDYSNGFTRTCERVRTPSELYRFFILVNRCIFRFYRDWTASQLKIVMHFLVGVFMGLMYSNCGSDATKAVSNVGFLMVSLVYLSYTALMPAILKFPSELNIIRKEQFNNWYKLSTFYAAFLTVNIPIQLIFSFIYAVFAYYLSKQVSTYWRFLKFLVVCQLITLLSEGCGLFLGTSLAPVNAVFLGAVIICLFILLAGFVALLNHMPVVLYYVTYTSFYRYAFEALIVSLYGNGRDLLICPKLEMYCHYRYPQKIFDELGMDEHRYAIDVLMLCLYVVSFFVMGYIGLKYRINNMSVR